MEFSNPFNLPFAESLWAQYLADPTSVDPSWRQLFDQLRQGNRPDGRPGPRSAPLRPECPCADILLQNRVFHLIEAFRSRGHRYARLDPLGLNNAPGDGPDLSAHGITRVDLDETIPAGTYPVAGKARLRDVIALLQQTYCGHVGVELSHIQDDDMRTWLQDRMEQSRGRLPLSKADKHRILLKLIQAETLEQFLHTKFVGAKRFSLEGGESLIPLLDLLIDWGGKRGVNEVVMGMAHRGRLNVLVNILDKQPEALFADFEDRHPEGRLGVGDVKYHLGYSSDRTLDYGHVVHLSLAFNPSHLEWVNTVVEGRTRAKQDRFLDVHRTMALPVIIHGDAAFAGQGLVMETMQLAGLQGYATGGTIHVIVNNQVGFTTPPEDSRSTPYCSDIGRAFHVPIFHVNGDDPEAVAFVVDLCMDFRQRFHRDVIIDLICYRKLGHNEGDEPAFTQPLMYEAIARKRSVAQLYQDHLVQEGTISEQDALAMRLTHRQTLEHSLHEARAPGFKNPPVSPMADLWLRYRGGRDADTPDVDTGIPLSSLRDLLTRVSTPPPDFAVHPKLVKLLEGRREMAEGKRPLDWGAAEALAFASLVHQGYPVRVSGQDARRGTFAHRHAVLRSVRDGSEYIPLQHVSPDQGRFDIWDSPLSEAGVLGFDYGYTLDYPDALTIWEAQFGDFANAAQVIVDQFLTSAEVKWNRLSGLVMFLPHGYEGQGPEHSSARVGRYLHLCAKDNIQVCNVTTPAQLFHLLRRQMLRPLRKPLVLFTPKSLLRHRMVVSPLEEFTHGPFQRLLSDRDVKEPTAVKRILLCSGKVYVDLQEARQEHKVTDVAILRLEQFYPFPLNQLREELQRHPAGTPLVWVQEEPVNMGAWHFLRDHLPEDLRLRYPLCCMARPENPSPATGSHAAHKLEQTRLVMSALQAPLECGPPEGRVVQVSANLPV